MKHRKPEINYLKISLLIFSTVATILLTNFPDFHPEKILGWTYSLSTDMLFHGSYYFFISLFLFFLVAINRAGILLKSVLLVMPAVLEGTQYFVHGRTISLTDLIANYIGIGLAILIWIVYRRLTFAKKPTLY